LDEELSEAALFRLIMSRNEVNSDSFLFHG